MVGVISVVQVVHYPLFRHAGTSSYATYQSKHMRCITWIVVPLMTIELGTVGVVVWAPPLRVPPWVAWTGVVLVVLLWGITGIVPVPLHRSLTREFDTDNHDCLVRTNWIEPSVGPPAAGWCFG